MGEGLTSKVYKAERADSEGYYKHTVAIKILKSRKNLSALQDEIKTLMSVTSSGVPKVYGWENFGSGSALIMEWIEGISLKDLARHAEFTLREIHYITDEAYRTLRDLKKSGVCHGDISPSNIMIEKSGRVRLIDFGVNLSLDQKLGSPRYFAPEIWSGEDPNIWSDFFSLGLIEVELRNGSMFHDEARDLKAASVEAAKRNSQLLCENASDRKWTCHEDLTDEELCEFQEKIEQAICRRESPQMSTFIQKRKSSMKGKFLKFAWALIFLLFGIISDASLFLPKGTVHIRTQSWYFIWMNSIPIGYTPVESYSLPAGHYKMEYASSKKSGVLEFQIKSGEIKNIDDSAFVD